MTTINRPLVGIAVIITNKSKPNCVLVGVRQSSHGAGQLAFPGE
jgi:hypothetical protein